MTTDDLIAYYEDLLILQYSSLPRATATVAAYVKQVIADQIAAQVRDGFSITTIPGLQPGDAEGVQLNAVASYRGVVRNIFGIDLTRTYFQISSNFAPLQQ